MGAQLGSADLRSADLSQANLDNANLAKADLRGANLHRAKITCEQIESALIDKGTKLPDYIKITGSPDSTYQCKNILKEK